MQLNLGTDYAVRAILIMAVRRCPMSIPELTETLKVPAGYMMKIMCALRKAGLVTSIIGAKGGYYLNRPAKAISLKDIYAAAGDEVVFNRCLEADGYCSRNATDTCPVHAFYVKLQAMIDERLAHTTIAGLIGGDEA